jgi:2-amino-4-hydroxy-6-hydroxymethyldihydropteridine diphosphokinase
MQDRDSITVFLSMGGNTGNVRRTFEDAIAALKALQGIQKLRIAPIYITTPVEVQPPCEDFLNTAIQLETTLSLTALKDALFAIERDLGKVPKAKSVPRPLDIDILFYGSEAYQQDGLVVPHPRWEERLFVLVPLGDLVDQLRIPDH